MCKKPEHPLNAFQKLNHFKFYKFDVVFINHVADVSNDAVSIKIFIMKFQKNDK
jgi:hypothetical protein